MSNLKYTGIIALSLTLSTAWAGGGHPDDQQELQEKPHIFTSQSVEITALVEAIDHETRQVTLRGPQGNSVTFIASEEARNLGQVEAGDSVNAEYVQSISIEVMANPGVQASAGELSAMGRTEKGEMPGMTAIDTLVATATVEEINLEANTFKLKGPDGLVEEFTARNPENLKRAAVGDLVVITHTEALALSVEKTVAE
jgi:hypothetical protein